MKKFCVLLSAYNGEKYIEQQIESLLKQKDVDISILIRDDGSKDNTVAILKKYEENSKIKIIYGQNVGFIKSFYQLVKDSPQADYYAFCDQDDIWNEDKLKNSLEFFDKESETLPSMYFCSLKVMNIEKDKIYTPNSHKNFKLNNKHPFAQSFYINMVYGCALVFNKIAKEFFLMMNDNQVKYHDWDMYMICAGCGKVFFDERPGLIYRQHRNNTIGFYKAGLRALKRNIKILFGDQFKNVRTKSMQKIYDIYQDYLTEESKKYAHLVLNYKNDKKSKKELLTHPALKTGPKDVRFLCKLLIRLKKF